MEVLACDIPRSRIHEAEEFAREVAATHHHEASEDTLFKCGTPDRVGDALVYPVREFWLGAGGRPELVIRRTDDGLVEQTFVIEDGTHLSLKTLAA